MREGPASGSTSRQSALSGGSAGQPAGILSLLLAVLGQPLRHVDERAVRARHELEALHECA